jgi:hypothetical protein
MGKKASTRLVVLLTGSLLWFGTVQALPLTLTNEYEVTSSAVNVGPGTWRFTYQITNVNQGAPGGRRGLDGFAIQIPDSAGVVGWTVPASYASGGYWTVIPECTLWPFDILDQADPDCYWMLWWGNQEASVYPPGSTATLSVTLSNVSLISNEGGLFTYWGRYVPSVPYYTLPVGTNYTSYWTELVSPGPGTPSISIPEPSALVLLGTGIAGLLGVVRRQLGVGGN